MPQAIVDPEELRQFARSLKKFNTELRDRLARLHHDLQGLGSSWRDQEHKKFTQEFEEHMKVIGRFLELTDKHVPYLLRKAEQIEQYLQS
jgi:WXG100 family type VII secretion target